MKRYFNKTSEAVDATGADWLLHLMVLSKKQQATANRGLRVVELRCNYSNAALRASARSMRSHGAFERPKWP